MASKCDRVCIYCFSHFEAMLYKIKRGGGKYCSNLCCISSIIAARAGRPCKRGNIAPRNKCGQCLCIDCKKLRIIRNKKYSNYYKEYHKKYDEKRRDYNNAKSRRNWLERKKRIPLWANKEQIRLVYKKSLYLTKQTGIQHHVDHIVPIHGKNVSGLHVENNLQILIAIDNIKKSNNWQMV